MPDNYRHAAYRLKVRWVEMLYKRGFCVQAYEEYGVWHLKFKIDGILFAWHIPDGVIHWQIKEMRGPVQFDYVEGLPLRKMGIQESIALIEWCLESKR